MNIKSLQVKVLATDLIFLSAINYYNQLTSRLLFKQLQQIFLLNFFVYKLHMICMTLTNILLFLILVTLTTYLFTPWKNMQKPPTKIIFLQFFLWLFGLGLLLIILGSLDLII